MRCLLWILSGCIPVCLSAQVTIRGEIKDRYSGDTLSNVNVRNIYTQKGMTVKPDGKFELVVRKGELVEFTCVGYQTVRLRIQSEKEPLYFYITMEKIPVMLREVDIRGKPLDFKKDSIRYEETYHLVLHKQRMEEIGRAHV